MNQLHLPFLKQVQGWNKKPYKDTVNKNFSMFVHPKVSIMDLLCPFLQ